MADEMLKIVQQFDPQLELKYNKFYIGLSKDGQPKNFVQLRPRKGHIVLELKVKQSLEIERQIDEAGLDRGEYNSRLGLYRIRLTSDDFKKHSDIVGELMNLAFTARNS